MCVDKNNMETTRIESYQEVELYLAKLRYALDNGASINIQMERQLDKDREPRYRNSYTLQTLFPDEEPKAAIAREIRSLTPENYIRTVKDARFPNRDDFREFGKKYNQNDDVYIKVRVELISGDGGKHVFVMSFHFAEYPFDDKTFPYGKEEQDGSN